MNRRGLADHVYEQLKEWLFESRYGRNGRLPVDEIAAEMDTSRQPVMDAVKRLELEGFVSVIPQVGCMVREYSPEEIHDFYQLFAYGEAQVAALAAQKAEPEDLISLRIISEQIGQLSVQKPARPNRATMYRTLNRRLHKEIRRIARSASLTELVESMGDRSDFFIAISGRPMFAEERRLTHAHAEHSEVLDAIIKHDPQAAAASMMHHILETDATLQEFMTSRAKSAKGHGSGGDSALPQTSPRRKTARAA